MEEAGKLVQDLLVWMISMAPEDKGCPGCLLPGLRVVSGSECQSPVMEAVEDVGSG